VEDLHRELARIAFSAGEDLGLMLAGGYAIRAHGLTERPSGDLDLATSARLPMQAIVERLSDSWHAGSPSMSWSPNRGWPGFR
jgi:hypothetical protein